VQLLLGRDGALGYGPKPAIDKGAEKKNTVSLLNWFSGPWPTAGPEIFCWKLKVSDQFQLAHFFLEVRHSAPQGGVPQLGTASGPIREQGLDAEAESRGEHGDEDRPRDHRCAERQDELRDVIGRKPHELPPVVARMKYGAFGV
jgi:hypothetical protein